MSFGCDNLPPTECKYGESLGGTVNAMKGLLITLGNENIKQKKNKFSTIFLHSLGIYCSYEINAFLSPTITASCALVS